MDRKRFLQGLALGGLAVGSGLVWRSSSLRKIQVQPIQISGIRYHVRHGLLNLSAVSVGEQVFPSWVPSLQRDHFYSNGLDHHPDDLLHVSIEVNGKPLGISLKGKELSITQRNGSTPLETEKLIPCHDDQLLKINLLHLSQAKELDWGKLGREHLLVSLQGSAQYKGYPIEDQHAVFLKGNPSSPIEVAKDATLLVISKT